MNDSGLSFFLSNFFYINNPAFCKTNSLGKPLDTPWLCLRGTLKKTNSIFKDIVQIGGREVNPISKMIQRNDFLTKVGEGGGHKTYCQK